MGRPVSSVFVGREAELDRLRTALAAAEAGRPSIVLLGGEAGVGKTRLVRELAESSAEPVRVRYGRCVPVADGELPFAPFVEAFRHLGTGPGAAHPALSSVFVDSEGRSGDEAHVLQVAGWTSQSNLFELVLEELGRLAADRPNLLVLEDLHWADRSSRELLLFLARNLESEAVLTIATYRTDELHRRHPLLRTIAELNRLPSVDRLDLGRLAARDVAALVEALGDAAWSTAAVDRIVTRAEGVPFHAEELVTAARDGRASLLPPSLLDTLTIRLAALPVGSQRLVRTAAAIGRRVDHRLLGTVTGMDDDTLTNVLRPSVERHILDVVDPVSANDEPAYEFRHALLAEAAYAELLPAERVAIHRAIATALEAAPGQIEATDAVRAAELAFHWQAAHVPERALAAAVTAGLAADRGRAPAEALGQYRRALELWPRVPDAPAAAGLDEAALHGQAAGAAYASGDPLGAARLAEAGLDHLPADAPTGRRVALLELLHLARWEGGDPVGARAVLDDALALVPPDREPRLRARILSFVSWRAFLEDRFDDARAASEEAVALASGTGDAASERLALFSLGSVLLHVGEVARSDLVLRRVASSPDVTELAVHRARARLAEVEVESGRVAEAIAMCHSTLADIRAVGLRGAGRAFSWLSLVSVLVPAGEWDEADAAIDECLTGDAPQAAAWAHMYRVWLRTWQGDRDGARKALVVADRHVGPTHNEQSAMRFIRTLVARADRDFQSGRREIAELLAQNTDLRYDTLPLAMVVGVQLEADRAVAAAGRRALGEAGEARRVGRGLADVMGRIVAASGERGSLPTLAGLAAQVAAERTRLDGAASPEAFERAATILEGAGRIYNAAECRFRAAEATLEAGRPRSAAQVPLRAAHVAAQRLGARGLLDDIVALAARARIELESGRPSQPTRPVRVPTPADPYGLTPREQEVLALVATGYSNRRIAERLFIAESTAGVHVSNVIGKLGVQGRAGAAAIGVRLGLVPPNEPGDGRAPDEAEVAHPRVPG